MKIIELAQKKANGREFYRASKILEMFYDTTLNRNNMAEFRRRYCVPGVDYDIVGNAFIYYRDFILKLKREYKNGSQ